MLPPFKDLSPTNPKLFLQLAVSKSETVVIPLRVGRKRRDVFHTEHRKDYVGFVCTRHVGSAKCTLLATKPVSSYYFHDNGPFIFMICSMSHELKKTACGNE